MRATAPRKLGEPVKRITACVSPLITGKTRRMLPPATCQVCGRGVMLSSPNRSTSSLAIVTATWSPPGGTRVSRRTIVGAPKRATGS